MLSIFQITILSPAGAVIDREQLPARAFSPAEAQSFGDEIAAAHGAGHIARCELTQIKAEW